MTSCFSQLVTNTRVTVRVTRIFRGKQNKKSNLLFPAQSFNSINFHHSFDEIILSSTEIDKDTDATVSNIWNNTFNRKFSELFSPNSSSSQHLDSNNFSSGKLLRFCFHFPSHNLSRCKQSTSVFRELRRHYFLTEFCLPFFNTTINPLKSSSRCTTSWVLWQKFWRLITPRLIMRSFVSITRLLLSSVSLPLFL